MDNILEILKSKVTQAETDFANIKLALQNAVQEHTAAAFNLTSANDRWATAVSSLEACKAAAEAFNTRLNTDMQSMLGITH